MSSLRIAARVRATTAEGPGLRYAIWVQGCRLACAGCCNPEMLPVRGGDELDVEALLRDIEEAKDRLEIDGITVLGGEPLEQMEAVIELVGGAHGLGLGVLLFTGFTLEEARSMPGFNRLWCSVDTLVDGRFDGRDLEPLGGRRWIGSRNQRLHHRSERYADPDLWCGENHAELQIEPNGAVTVHGFPADVSRLMKRLRIAKNELSPEPVRAESRHPGRHRP